MKFDFWKIMNTIFYYVTFVGGVAIVLKTDFKSLLPVEVLYVCGSIGGMLYLGEYFRKETQSDAVHAESETKNDAYRDNDD